MSAVRTLEESSMHKYTVKSLVQAVQHLSLARNIETVMHIVRKTARAISGAHGATFVLRENDKCYYADEDAIGPLWKGQRFPLHSCVSGWAMIHRQSVVIENIYSDSRIPIDAYRPTFVKSLVMVPIRSIDPIGAIGTYWARHTVPSDEEVIMLQSLADITAVTMENIQVYNELEERVKERTRELINSLNREKEMSARRRQFFSMASHEIKTPITSILTSTSILEEYNEGPNAEQRAKHLNRINASSQQLIGIVNDFLSSEKLDQGKTEMLYESFDVKQFVTCVIEQMESSLKSGQTIRYTHHGDTEIVLVKNMLNNILLNLLSNASKYSFDDQPIDLYIEISDNEITIQVKDYGIGIPEADQPQIFNNFFRATNATGIEGTGLGLHIVKRYMELLNGSIRFSSRHNEGTTFTVQCPGRA
jgi:hypothetical protein